MQVNYPLGIKLKDKTELSFRPFEFKDVLELKKFFKKIPKYDLVIFKDDVCVNETIDSWFIDPKCKKLFHLLVFNNRNKVIANGTLHNEGLYLENTAEIKIIVEPKYRNRGLGTQIFNILLHEGFKGGIQKFIIRYTSDNRSVIKMLANYGFGPEVILNYYIEDKKSKLHKDLIIASLDVQGWKRRFQFYNSLF